jgi:SAM-dependent methyltransferase
MLTNLNELLEAWKREEMQPFEGWDFSYLRDRMTEDQPPWSYTQRAAELMQGAKSVIDLDTGGGERLLDLRQHWPRRVVVTENYPPNTRLVYERLTPVGAAVIMASNSDSAALPFASGVFDLVLNRHGSYNPAELARVLAPGGTFLTKQVHGLWAADLLAVFGASPEWPDNTSENCIPALEMAGLKVVNVEDWRGKLRFTDVGAVVYYLRAIPWLVPGFSVETHQAALMKLQERVEHGNELAFDASTFLIEARR